MSLPRKIAISDIHGCNNTFGSLLDQIAFSTEDELYILGDLIDRGPDSKGVIDRAIRMQEEGYQVTCVRGNHEQLLLEATSGNEAEVNLWLTNGGIQTLRSFGVEEPPQIPSDYKLFLSELPYFVELEDYVLVHAGLNLQRTIPLMDQKSMLWIRHWHDQLFENTQGKAWLGDRVIIHGHTPIPPKRTQDMLLLLDQLPALNIDNGCVFAGKQPALGMLCAFDMTNRLLYWEEMEG